MLRRRASTIRVISIETGIPSQTVYRHMCKLENLGYLERVIPSTGTKASTGGRNPGIWGFVTLHKQEDVARAVEEHRRKT
ncbi:unnamed protein product, partial [marine sediment metagenome]